jgi:hypothetical protein
MTEQINEDTLGSEPILYDGENIPIADKVYHMRRLGIKDAFRFNRIITLASIAANKSGATGGSIPLEQLIITYAEEDILDFLGDIIGVTPEDLVNPELFPMDAILVLYNHLMNHKDIKAFLFNLERLQGSSSLQTHLNAVST